MKKKLWIFTNDFEHGFILDARTGEKMIMGRFLQRSQVDSLPSEAVSWETLAGTYVGQSVMMTTAGLDSYSVGGIYVDQFELSFQDKLSIEGTFGQKTFSALMNQPANDVANRLGFLKGTADIENVSFNIYTMLSPDRQSIVTILCPASGACPVGDNSGTYDASSFQLGLFSRQ